MNMGCLGDCLDVGPPPDSILFLPPPPAPSFLQPSLPDVLLNTTPCSATQLCDSLPSANKIPEGIGQDYVELHRKELESWSVSSLDDTWLLVLVASSIGVLLLGALLAMFLLKCREMNMFGSNDCSIHSRDHRPIKTHEQRECSSMNNINGNKPIHPADSVLYHGATNLQDNRMVWAALNPRGGTHHFISESYPSDLVDYAEDHYETIENISGPPPVPSPPVSYTGYQHNKSLSLNLVPEKSTFENSGFVDYEYEDPTPLIDGYQRNGLEHEYSVPGSNAASLGYASNTLRKGLTLTMRPRVSSPTRIEHPNLPPLNLYPHKNNTLKRNNITFKSSDMMGTLPKYT